MVSCKLITLVLLPTVAAFTTTEPAIRSAARAVVGQAPASSETALQMFDVSASSNLISDAAAVPDAFVPVSIFLTGFAFSLGKPGFAANADDETETTTSDDADSEDADTTTDEESTEESSETSDAEKKSKVSKVLGFVSKVVRPWKFFK